MGDNTQTHTPTHKTHSSIKAPTLGSTEENLRH